MASQPQTTPCLYFGSRFARAHANTASFILWGFWRSNVRLSRLQDKHFTQWAYRSGSHLWVLPLKSLSFHLHRLILVLKEVLFRSTYSHNKHKYLVKIQCRWWQCSLSQSRLCSDAGVLTCAPCVTCFYKSTFIGIQQPSLYCSSICFCANPSWAQ